MTVISWASQRRYLWITEACVCFVRRWYWGDVTVLLTHTHQNNYSRSATISISCLAQIPSQQTPRRPTGKYNSIYSVTSLFISKEMHSGPVICIKISCDNWHRFFLNLGMNVWRRSTCPSACFYFLLLDEILFLCQHMIFFLTLTDLISHWWDLIVRLTVKKELHNCYNNNLFEGYFTQKSTLLFSPHSCHSRCEPLIFFSEIQQRYNTLWGPNNNETHWFSLFLRFKEVHTDLGLNWCAVLVI